MDENKRELTKEQLRIRQQRRRYKRKMLLIKRGIAFCVLIALSVGVVFLVNKVVKMITTKTSVEASKNESGSNKQKDVVEKAESGKAEIQNVEMEEINEVKIKISAAGDCTLGTDENFDASSSFKAKYNEVGYPGYFFENVRSIFEEDDLSIVNLEGTFTTSTNRQDKTFAFKGDPSYVEILKEGSIEAVNLANNHSKDYGIESFEDTKKYVTEAGITAFGYEQTQVIDIKGIKVGLVGIYELADGIGRLQQVKDNIAKVKEEGAVLTIVSFHWGTEKANYPNEVQKELAHAAIDSGADLVVGHHPHVLQGIETYNGKKIVYSLGNFCFGGNKNPSDKDTMIFQQTFTIKGNEVVLDEDVNIIPCSISSVSSHNNYKPTVAEGEKAQEILKKIETFSNGL